VARDPVGSFLPRFLPFTGWRRPDASTLRADLLAGIAVSLLAIPQSLAYAQLAGVPPHYGLYAAFLPSIIAVLFGSSGIVSTGPVALTSLLTAASVSQLAPAGSSQFFAYVTLLALVSGLFQLALGLARAGVLVNLLSHPVLMGFVNAAALLIALSQLPALTGIGVEASGWLLLDVGRMLLRLDTLHPWTLALGVLALALLYGFRRFAPKLPGVVIMVVALTVLSYAIGFAERGGRVVGAVPAGLPSFAVPDANWPAMVALLPAAFVIALISFMEVMSSAKVIAIKTRTRWDENQELIGQGLAKIVAGFSQSMPVSGSFSRSALNLASGARTGWSAMFAAAFVLLTLLFLTPLFFHLPQPALAAMIIMAVFNLFDFGALRRAWRANRDDGIAAVVTFVATLMFAPNIQNGILTGVLLSLGAYIYRRMTPRTSVAIITVPASHEGQPATAVDTGELLPATGAGESKVHVLTFDAALFFGNISFFEEAVLRIVESDPGLTRIAVDASGINGIDASAVEVIRSLVKRLRDNGATLAFFDAKPRFIEVATRTGLLDEIGAANVSAADARGPLQVTPAKA
jgi:SulP family sulfate permease